MRTITTIVVTALVTIQVLFHGIVNAKTYWGVDVYGNNICDIEIYGFRFSFWQHNENDYTLYKGV